MTLPVSHAHVHTFTPPEAFQIKPFLFKSTSESTKTCSQHPQIRISFISSAQSKTCHRAALQRRCSVLKGSQTLNEAHHVHYLLYKLVSLLCAAASGYFIVMRFNQSSSLGGPLQWPHHSRQSILSTEAWRMTSYWERSTGVWREPKRRRESLCPISALTAETVSE